MNKFVLLLVLTSGFLSGYLIGDYRGKDARETLMKVTETGKMLDSEQEIAIASLRKELDSIDDKHHRELAAIRKENASRMSEWRRTKDGLDDKIKLTTAQLAESDSKLKSLAIQRDGSSGKEKDSIDQEIARLRKVRENLQREIEGDACLQARIPHSVSAALNDTNAAGR